MLSFPTISPAQAITSLRPQDVAGLTPAAAPATPGISDLTPATGPIELRPAQQGDSFATMLGRMIDEVSAKQGAAVDAVGALQSGQNVPLHQAVIAMEEANVSFQLMVEVRNKLLDSYQELMRMQI